MSTYRPRRGASKSNGYEGFSLHKSSITQRNFGSNSVDLVTVKTLLKKFDSGEKRQWPVYINELSLLFQKPSFLVKNEQSLRIFDEVTRVFARILTTKLFPDIVEEIITCLSHFTTALGPDCKQLFDWIFELYYSSIPNETRLVLLRALVEIVKSGKYVVLQNVSDLLENIKKALEAADTCELLLGITDILIVAAENYPEFMQYHFRDIVDILIGWHIDSSQSPIMTAKLAKAFKSFETFWLCDFDFSLTLMEHFLEDFTAFFSQLIQDNEHNSLSISDNSSHTPSFRLNKMASLVRVYITVLQSFAGLPRAPNMWENTLRFLRIILHAVTRTMKMATFESLIISTSECAVYTIQYAAKSPELLTLSEGLLAYLNSVHNSMADVSDAYIITTLQLMIEFVKNYTFPTEFIINVLQPGSNCSKLRLLPSFEIQQTLYELHHAILETKDLSLFKETYKCFLLDAQIAIAALLKKDKSLPECINITYSEEESIIVIKSILISLCKIARAKPLIGMWLLKPSLFDLLVYEMDPSHDVLARDFPDLQYSILYLCKYHCSKLNNLIFTSSVVQSSIQASELEKFLNPMESTTMNKVDYLMEIFKLLKAVLVKNITYVHSKVRLLCLEWFNEIIASLSQHLNQLLNTNEFKEVLAIVSNFSFSEDISICLLSCSTIEILLKEVDNFPYDSILMTYFHACLVNIGHPHEEIRDSFLKLYSILPKKCFAAYKANITPLFPKNRAHCIVTDDIKNAKIALMKEEPNCFFSVIGFRSILNFIFDSKLNFDVHYLQRLYYLYFANFGHKTLNKQQNINKNCKVNIFEHNIEVIVFWSCWQVMQYCIINRLRTHLGKAPEIFLKIESAIRKMLQNSDSKLNALPTHCNEIYHIKMLLYMMENLDKLMYHAYEGTSSRIFNTPKLAKTFFCTNRTTCVDWMHRNRMSIMKIALLSHDFAAVWRNGEELLRDIAKKGSHNRSEVGILTVMIEALVKLKAPDAILGLYVWAKMTFGVRYAWIKSAFKEAQGKYEIALTQYIHLYLEEYQEDPEMEKSPLKEFLCNRISDCYTSLGWQDELSLCKRVLLYDSSVSETNQNKDQIRDFSYLYSWKELNATSKEPSWSVRNCFEHTKYFLSKVSNYINSDFSNNKIGIASLDQIHKLISSQISASIIFNPSLHNEKLLINYKIVQNLNEVLQSKKKNKKIVWDELPFQDDTTRTDPSILVYKLKMMKDCLPIKASFGLDAEDESIDEMYLLAAKSARKHSNLRLCIELLLKYSGEYKESFNSLEPESLTPMLQHFESNSSKKNMLLLAEAAKLYKTEETINYLAKCLVSTYSHLNPNLNMVWSKCLVTMTKLIQLNKEYLMKSSIKEDFFLLLDKVKIDDNISFDTFRPNEALCGKLLYLCTEVCPSMKKGWFKLGSWAYKCWIENEKRKECKLNNEEHTTAFLRLSTKCYFQYLSFNYGYCDSNDITVTLRLFNIIMKRSRDLTDILETYLNNTPTRPWKNIILKLFTNLDNSDHHLRRIIYELLSRISLDAAHLVVFPIVSASFSNNGVDLIIKNKFNKCNPDDVMSITFGNYHITSHHDKSVRNCFKALMETLALQNPQLVLEIKTFIKELRRINILWDELWISLLTSNIWDIHLRVYSMNRYVESIMQNEKIEEKVKDQLIKARHKTLFANTIFYLKQAAAITSEPCETPHENWFQKTFSKHIEFLLASFENPKESTQSLQKCEMLLKMLQRESSKWKCNRSYLMSTISPVLSKMQNTIIPMPGIVGMHEEPITIKTVHKNVALVHSKTRPKKIAFCGSDGRTQPYLFKGREDLHLDEKIMHFLTVVNKMFAKEWKNMPNRALFRARHYSVTPLGIKSGLIQWIDGCSSLLSFYNGYIQAKEKKDKNFYEIFNKKLANKGARGRSRLSQSSLVEILKELILETPNNLISQEFWCSSASAFDYWKLTQTFAQSNAVMCMIGYVIGLGDRHGDNILVDLTTGEIVHVDYNICFELGKSLRVPEMVPCRLTQNIVSAFGITGVEGTFRKSCEHVLNVLRNGIEVLVRLLETFVYAPSSDFIAVEENYSSAFCNGDNVEESNNKFVSSYQIEIEGLEAHIKMCISENLSDIKTFEEGLNKMLQESVECLKLYEESESAKTTSCEYDIEWLCQKLNEFSCQMSSLNLISDSYKDKILSLFKELIRMKNTTSKSDKASTQLYNYYTALKKLNFSLSENFLLHSLCIEISKAKIDIMNLQKLLDYVYGVLIKLAESYEQDNCSIEDIINSFEPIDQDLCEDINNETGSNSMGTYSYLYEVSKVRKKLEGMDPDPKTGAMVQHQVNYVIKESMSLNNLALMYEGWMPWF